MRILVTGASGFVGRYLARDLSEHGHIVIGLDISFADPPSYCRETIVADLADASRIHDVFRSVRPDACVHLGGIAFVPAADIDPFRVLAINTLGTVHVLDAARSNVPQCRVLTVSSGQVYGPGSAYGPALDEDSPLRPVSLYAISKAAADLATLGYARHYGLWAITARPNNHTGPGQSPSFAVPSFARQVRAIARGASPPVLRVGNIESRRDILDVRDVVTAYRLLIEKGRPGLAYNIAANRDIRIGDILMELCRLADIHPRVETDPSLFRPPDSSPVLSIERLKRDTGWSPTIPLEKTLRDVLEGQDP